MCERRRRRRGGVEKERPSPISILIEVNATSYLMPETRQKLQLKGAAVSLYRASTTAPADPFNCSIIRGPRFNSSFFIYPLQFTIACNSRGIILRSFVYSLLIIKVSSFYLEYFFLFLFFEIEQDLRVRRHFEKKRSAASFACSKKKRDPRRYVPRVYEDPPVRGGDRFRRAKSTMSSDVLERERKEKRKKGDR